MLRIHTSTSPAVAKSYFSFADYYSEGQELLGVWRGEAATRLGLHGEIKKADWDRLCDNLDPATGRSLTQRRKAERRVGYDFTFDVPKSVSLLYGLTGDERLLDAFRSAVDDTMREIETDAQVRVRKGGMNEDRTTGNLVWGQYVHFTSRPVDGVPDPQLHAHCFAFNATWDDHESRFKAAQIGAIKRDAPYYQAMFDSRFARSLGEMGLPIERTRTGWDIQGLRKATLDRFSRRTAQIEALAKDKGITDPREKAALGARIREHKAKHIPMSELREQWRSRLTPEEADGIARQQRAIGMPSIPLRDGAAREAVQLAADHCFERSSVVPERKLLAEALKRSVGEATLDIVRDAYAQAGFITADRYGQRLVTTTAVLAEEQRMIDFACSGRGTRRRLGPAKPHRFKRDKLNQGQRNAVEHVLASPDRVILIRGAAGVGKTSMMQEAAEAIEANGRKVFTFAPSANASRGVLRQKNFANADTVARLLVDEKMQESTRDQVLWVDEAGLLGSRTMRKLFDVAERMNARVILSGDRRQHGSVERGAALRLLEEEAGLVPASIREIVRQQGAYKVLVRSLSEGRTEAGFRALDKLNWIKEVPTAERYQAMAADYVEATSVGKTALVVSPTHAEGERITQSIRSTLQATGRLSTKHRSFPTLQRTDLTQAERTDAVNYMPDSVLVFHQNAKGFRKGQRVPVANLNPANLPLDQAERFGVFRAASIDLAPGDLVRITQNGQTADRQHALNNGAVYAIKGFTPKGDLLLSNGWTVGKDFGHLAYGYVSTSHASQGRDVQRVLIGQSSESFPASSREQFYVSVSRGTEQVTVYTDDKENLLDAISRSDERLSATELVGGEEPGRHRAQPSAMSRRDSRERDAGTPPNEDVRRIHHPDRDEQELIHDR